MPELQNPVRDLRTCPSWPEVALSSGDNLPASRPDCGAATCTRVRRVSPLLLILLAGAIIRLALWSSFQHEPPRIWDECDYNALAKNLAQHGEFGFAPGRPVTIRPPLYPTLLAGVYSIFGLDNYQAVRLVQIVISLLTVAVLYGLGLAVGSRRTALWLAGLYCFYPSMIGYTNLLLTETLFTLLLCSACYTLVLFYKRDVLAYLVATGLLLGLAALTRSVVWLAPPLLAAYLLVTLKGTWRRRLLASAALVASFALTLAPWAIRNSRLEGSFVAVDTMGGRNFMMGNYRYTPLYRSWDAITLEKEQSWFHEIAATYPLEQRGTQGKIDKLALRQGLQFVKDHPWLTFQRDVIKFFDFWGLERELVAGAGRGFFGELPRPILVVLMLLIFGSYTAAMVLAVYGILLAPLADRRLHWFLLSVIAFICGMHTLVFAHSRYHLPVMPLMLVFAANALVGRREIWRQRHRWSFRLAGGLCGVLLVGWVWGLLAGDWERFLSLVAMWM